MLFTSGVALMMRSNKQLLAHPNSLIYYMCICEGIIAWQAAVSHIGVTTFICYFRLDEIFMHTTFWKTTEHDVFDLMR